MKFSVTEIRGKPGESLSVTLVNVGTMPKLSMGHNFVLLAPDVLELLPDAALRDRAEHMPMLRAHPRAMGVHESIAMSAHMNATACRWAIGSPNACRSLTYGTT